MHERQDNAQFMENGYVETKDRQNDGERCDRLGKGNSSNGKDVNVYTLVNVPNRENTQEIYSGCAVDARDGSGTDFSIRKYSYDREDSQNVENEMKQQVCSPLITTVTNEQNTLCSGYDNKQKQYRQENCVVNGFKVDTTKLTNTCPKANKAKRFSLRAILNTLKKICVTSPSKTAGCLSSIFKVVLMIIALTSLALSVHVFFVIREIQFELDSNGTDTQPITSSVHVSGSLNAADNVEPRAAALFYLDERRLKDKKQITWNTNYSTANGNITPSPGEPCLAVHIDGIYGMFTAIAFQYTNETNEQALSYVIVVRSDEPSTSNVVQKTIVMLPPQDLRADWTMQSLSTSAVLTLKAKDRVCAIMPVELIDLVYLSTFDNYITMFKVS